MAKPRVFVSSTYYDLRHIRNSLETFIEDFGYEAVLFEHGDIAFRHDKSLDESCRHEVKNCHMLILIIGGRYGSPSSDNGPLSPEQMNSAYEQYNSVTKTEYVSARDRDIPIFIFVEKGVFAEYSTFKENRGNTTIKYAHVDSINIFRLLDEILAQRHNNYVRPFDSFEDISKWLRDQWAGLFADFLSEKSSTRALSDLSSQLGDLRQVTSVLKEYSESIMRKVNPDDYQTLIEEQERKLRQSRINRFMLNPINKGVLSAFMPKSKLIPEKLYAAFERANSVEEYFQLATDDNLMRYTSFISRHREELEYQFEKLKHEISDDELLKAKDMEALNQLAKVSPPPSRK